LPRRRRRLAGFRQRECGVGTSFRVPIDVSLLAAKRLELGEHPSVLGPVRRPLRGDHVVQGGNRDRTRGSDYHVTGIVDEIVERPHAGDLEDDIDQSGAAGQVRDSSTGHRAAEPVDVGDLPEPFFDGEPGPVGQCLSLIGVGVRQGHRQLESCGAHDLGGKVLWAAGGPLRVDDREESSS